MLPVSALIGPLRWTIQVRLNQPSFPQLLAAEVRLSDAVPSWPMRPEKYIFITPKSAMLK
jgi:hypothetical protein